MSAWWVKKMRHLGLDFGNKTIGVAISCPEAKIATGLETIRRTESMALRESIHRLGDIIAEYGVATIVLGYPKNLDGSLSAQCEKTLAFKEKLERNFNAITIKLWDERLSTRAVSRAFPGARYHERVDEMAAVYILQGYLDYNQKKEEAMENELKTEWGDGEEMIVMSDDDGSEQMYQVLATRDLNNAVYLLTVATVPEESDDADDDVIAEVLHFKCIEMDNEDEMVFELVDGDHEDFEQMLKLFEEDYEALEIQIERD